MYACVHACVYIHISLYIMTTHLEKQLVSRQALNGCEKEGRERKTVALGQLLTVAQFLHECLRGVLVLGQCLHCHLELVHVRTVHVEELGL